MKLQDLKVGEKITLEVVWGISVYPIPTMVVASTEEGTIIKPFVVLGTVLELGSEQFRDMHYNINGVTPVTKEKVSWKNVNVQTKVLKDVTYYIIRTKEDAEYGNRQERREHPRMTLDLKGTATVITEEEALGKDKNKADNMVDNILGIQAVQHEIRVHDISDSGISFYTHKDVEFMGHYVKIEFGDKVKNKYFESMVFCLPNRCEDKGEWRLYGCDINRTAGDLLLYVFLKRMEK